MLELVKYPSEKLLHCDFKRNIIEDAQLHFPTDKEAQLTSTRENVNDTVVQLTENIKTSAQYILKGFIKVDEKVVGDQEVAVTIRWDVDSDMSRKQLEKAMR